MTLARSVARAVASPVARAVVGGIDGGGVSAWDRLLADANLLVRLNGDANADGTGDANDYAGNFNATWTGTPAYLDPAPLTDGKSFSLDGSTNHLTLPNAADSLTDNFSVCCWINLDTMTGTPRIAAKRGSPLAWEWYIDVGNARMTLYTGAFYVSASSVLSAGTWIHVGFTINGSSSAFFVNGSVSGSLFTPTITANTVDITIGRYSASATGWLDGRVSDFRIYDRALSADDFSVIAAGP